MEVPKELFWPREGLKSESSSTLEPTLATLLMLVSHTSHLAASQDDTSHGLFHVSVTEKGQKS